MSTLQEIFETIDKDGMQESFTTDHDLNNIEAMAHWLEESGFENNVLHDDGMQVVLFHEDFDRHIIVDSYGLGDFFTHGISLALCTDEDYCHSNS